MRNEERKRMKKKMRRRTRKGDGGMDEYILHG